MIIKKDTDSIMSYFEDSSNLKGGYAEEVVMPSDAAELSEFLKGASRSRMPVTISGGGTATTGSRVPFGGAVVSLEKMNKIIDVSAERMSAVVESGALVDDLKAACERKRLFYTSHPTEKTATLGGTVSTNASGARSFKYGPTRKWIKALEMVLAGGEVVRLKRGEKFLLREDSTLKVPDGRQIEIPLPTYRMPDVKSSAGYFAKDGMDAIDLFIGQEGTLSVITRVELGLAKVPEDIYSCFVFFRNPADSWAFAEEARGVDALSIEYFDKNALRLLESKYANVPPWAEAAIFFEQDITSGERERSMEKWTAMIERHGASIEDTWFAEGESEIERFAEFRHSVPEMVNDIIRRRGLQKLSTDIAVPPKRSREMMDFYVSACVAANIEHVIFGHVGESHLHVNLLPRSEDEYRRGKEICLEFVRKGVSLGGTASAEHGIGKIKHKFLEEMYGRAGLLEMARIKKALDPNCILGLDNIFFKELLNEI
jgi:D-lactate dehydrogenase (cytochrome)